LTSKLIQCYRLGKTWEKESFGVAFIADNRSNENILGLQTISEKICTLRMKTKLRNITSIIIHAPTEDKMEEEKENFYAQKQHMIRLQTMMSESSWGTKRPKLDRKENMTQL
jgi:hypothetical protein